MVEEAGLPPSPVLSQSGQPEIKTSEAPKENSFEKQDQPEISASPKVSSTVFTSTVKKPLVAKGTGKTGGLGARKLTSKPNESLYDQKPEEPVAPASAPSTAINNNNNPTAAGASLASRFEYVETLQSFETNSGGSNVLGHVAPPKFSSFFAYFGMDSGFPKKAGSFSSKVQVQETDEARKKFLNAKSISSAQFFGDQSKSADVEAQASLQKFSGAD